MNGKREYGDYQTPVRLTDTVCKYLQEIKQVRPLTVIEPTCGIGNFLQSSLVFDAQKYYGIEINPDYCNQCRARFHDERIHIYNRDFFSVSIKEIIGNASGTLVIGNPPWVTNSALSAAKSNNMPEKSNFKGLKGLDAITGASNFDICEYIILKLIYSLLGTDSVIAMLCKASVARNIFKTLVANNIGFEYFDMLKFNAVQEFGIYTSACVLNLKLSLCADTQKTCHVYSIDDWNNELYSLSVSNDHVIRNTRKCDPDFDGPCGFTWHQGLKHDCSKIMELTDKNGTLYNGNGDAVDIEKSMIFPLVKSSMLKEPIMNNFSKYVLVTQKKLGDETRLIEANAPNTWKYLTDHAHYFERRKSSIYRGAPPFSMFGIGPYSYARFKVVVSGFYKKPLFSLVYSSDERSVMTDDTCYFIGFDSYDMAYVSMLLLNSQPVQSFLTGIVFLDAKRPYTKKTLERLSFQKMFSVLTFDILRQTERELSLAPYVTASMYASFQNLPEICLHEQLELMQIS